MITRFRKSLLFSRIRQYFPMQAMHITDDRDKINDAEIINIEWPVQIKKPRVGIVQDFGPYPSWTKHVRFLENNSFPYDIYHIHSQDWLEEAKDFDVIVGITSSAAFHLEEIRTKYYILETCLDKTCFPSMKHTFLYEDKKLEAFWAEIYRIPFAKTYVSYDKEDALRLIENLTYPVISKVVPSSASVGVEMVNNIGQAKKIVHQAFSHNGRKTHIVYTRQKNYIYFQNYIPNDGYDIRVIVIGKRVYGYYRKVMKDDFRASGSHIEEMKDLPEEAMKIARKANQVINSPQLVVDMIFGLDKKYYINEYSPICQMSTLNQLRVNGTGGAYVFADDDTYHFEPGNYWVHEMALKEFFENHYLARFSNRDIQNKDSSPQ